MPFVPPVHHAFYEALQADVSDVGDVLQFEDDLLDSSECESGVDDNDIITAEKKTKQRKNYAQKCRPSKRLCSTNNCEMVGLSTSEANITSSSSSSSTFTSSTPAHPRRRSPMVFLNVSGVSAISETSPVIPESVHSVNRAGKRGILSPPMLDVENSYKRPKRACVSGTKTPVVPLHDSSNIHRDDSVSTSRLATTARMSRSCKRSLV